MHTVPTQEENPGGLHGRYIVSKVNGEPVDERAEYFILRLDRNASDVVHLAACRKAIMTYATAIMPVLPVLALDLVARYATKDVCGLSLWVDGVVHMLNNMAKWPETAVVKEINNNIDIWKELYQMGFSPLEAHLFNTDESSHHA